MPDLASGDVLLTGAAGFVGSRLWPALNAAGLRVRCVSRDAERAAHRWPDRAVDAGRPGRSRRPDSGARRLPRRVLPRPRAGRGRSATSGLMKWRSLGVLRRGRACGGRAHRLPRRRRPAGDAVRAPAQPAGGRRSAPCRARADHRIARRDGRGRRQHLVAHRPGPDGAPARDGPATLDADALAARGGRRRRGGAVGGRPHSAAGEHLVRPAGTRGAHRPGDP